MEAPLAELGPGPRNQHVTAFSRMQVCPPRDVSNRHTDVPEVGWAGAVNTVKSSYGHLVKDLLAHWQPMKHIAKNWGDVMKLASTDDQTGSSINMVLMFYWRSPRLTKTIIQYIHQSQLTLYVFCHEAKFYLLSPFHPNESYWPYSVVDQD